MKSVYLITDPNRDLPFSIIGLYFTKESRQLAYERMWLKHRRLIEVENEIRNIKLHYLKIRQQLSIQSFFNNKKPKLDLPNIPPKERMDAILEHEKDVVAYNNNCFMVKTQIDENTPQDHEILQIALSNLDISNDEYNKLLKYKNYSNFVLSEPHEVCDEEE